MAGLARVLAIHGDGVGDAVWKEVLGKASRKATLEDQRPRKVNM